MRVWFYKELSSCDTTRGLDSFVDRVEGSFGGAPFEVVSLLNSRRIELWGERCCFSKIVQEDSFVDIFLDLFFWGNKIDSLFTVLFSYKFTLLNGGSVVRVPLKEGELLAFLKNVFEEIKNVK